MTHQELNEYVAEVRYSTIPELSKKKIIDILLEYYLRSTWIPCDQLPENGVYTLVLVRKYRETNFLITPDEDKVCAVGLHCFGDWYDENGHKMPCIGWMPLPGTIRKTVNVMENVEAKDWLERSKYDYVR